MPTWLATARHYEVLKFATENKAVIGIQTLAMMKSTFDKMPPAAQKAILEAAAEAQDHSNKLDQELLETARAHARKLGVQTYRPTPAEMEQWRTTGRQIWKEFEPKIDKQLLNVVLEAQK
jgi:TRAP-type transport system periplasmic protein